MIDAGSSTVVRRITYPALFQCVAPIFILALFWIIHAVDEGSYWRLVMPEHLQPGIQYLEWAQFLAYCGAAAVAASSLKRLDDHHTRLTRLWLWIFLAGCIFLALEEISYGQRIFNFSVPDVVYKVNLQHELNLHNTRLGQRIVRESYILVGLIGGLGWLSRPMFRNHPVINLVTPDWNLSAYFLPVGIFFLWVEMFREPGSWLHQELFEFILAVGVFQFAVMNHRKTSRRIVL